MEIVELKKGILKTAPKDTVKEVARFYSAMKYGDLERCRKFCINSNLVAFYRVDGKIAGAIRATSDEVRFAYLVDLFVNPGYGKRGIGSSLLKSVCRYYGEMKIDYIELNTDPDDPGLDIFYRKCGLKEEKGSKIFYWKHKTKKTK